MRQYIGNRTLDGCQVLVVIGARARPLNPRLDLCNHSPTGFEWGYAGSGPAQLALALLADAFRETERHKRADRIAASLHQSFKSAIVEGLPKASWNMTDEQVRSIASGLPGFH